MSPKFRSLLTLEIRRAGRPILRGLGMIVAILILLVAIGRFAPETVGLVLVAAAVSIMLTVPSGALVDKLEGTMQFVAFLPVAGATVAGAKFAANALFALPLAIAIAVSVFIGWAEAPALGPQDRFLWALGTFFTAWLLGAALASLAVGAVAKYNMQKVMTVFALPAIAGMFVLERFAGDPREWFARAFAADLSRLVASVGVVAIVTAFGALGAGFLMLRSAYDNFEPKPDAQER